MYKRQVQAWVDIDAPDAPPDQADAPFLVNPAVFRMAPDSGQTLRIVYTGQGLPGDRESLFHLNVLQIPPRNSSHADRNQMLLMLRNRLKLFYRPAGIQGRPEDLPGQLRFALVRRSAGWAVRVDNPSGYYASFASATLSVGQRRWRLRSGMLEPRSHAEWQAETREALPPGRVRLHALLDVYKRQGQAYPAWDYPRIIASSDSVGGDPSSDWGYQSQPGAIGHPIHAIRGKVLGGSSAINGAVAIRARREDFARWNLPGWSYDDLLPAFRRLETRQGGDPALHGGDGPLPVRQLSRADLSPMQRAFVDATLANGFKAIADFDGADANGVGPYPMNVVNGVRAVSYTHLDVYKRQQLLGGDADFERLVAQVVGFVESPQLGLDLPLDVRGTAFQERVWQALREIPPGSTASYAQIAERIGAPRAVRAVAQACAANRIAVAIPCHRVVRRDGDISGYRWGVERKRELLRREERD